VTKFGGLTIAVPREILAGERRVAAIPQTVKKYVEAGARVIVETGAGKMAFYEDDEYVQAGAVIAPGAPEVYQNADIIIKVKEPKFNEKIGKHEVELFPENSVLVCFLHPASPANHEMIKMLAERGVTSLTLDNIPRISRAQHMDALTSMSTVAGYKAVIIAAHNLSRFVPMIPTASGIMEPSQITVVGVGVAGLQAIATAKRLGAKVKALDIRPEANEQAQSLGAKIIPFDLPDGLGVGEGGYAKRLPEQWYSREKEILASHLKESDAVILAALIPGEEAPILLDKPMVEMMKKGSVVVDISIDQGGNCDLTRRGEEYDYQGVYISGLLNIPAYLPIDAANMFAQNTFNYLNHLVEDGKFNFHLDDEIIRCPLVTKDYKIVHEGTLKSMEKTTCK
jgi:H+-translocating NAD(P) transhydrogenase subunit alpha